jgi:hypothetical protein
MEAAANSPPATAGEPVRRRSVGAGLRSIAREPLVHFLAVATILFFALAGLDQPDDAIEIDRARLVQFMQERARIFDEDNFSAMFDRLTPAERAALVEDYALSEALYRTAQANSFDQSDPLIRQRMIQQMRLLLQDQVTADLAISDEEVRTYFEQHRQDYAQPATLTFTHVFIDGRKHGDATDRMATATLQELRANGTTFEQAGNFGDLFPYRRNYIDVSREQARAELGVAVADALFQSQRIIGQWEGPFRSELGSHLVLISSRDEAALPNLADMEELVRQDALFAKRERETGAIADRLLGEFEVRMADDIGTLAERPS